MDSALQLVTQTLKTAPGRTRRSWLWLVLAVSVPANLAAAGYSVVINEVHYHPGDDSRDGEFLEIHNYGEEAADISGWQLAGGVRFVFEAGVTLPPDGFLLVVNDPELAVSRYRLDPSLIAGEFDGNLDNAGETVELLTDRGDMVSFVDYGDSDPWPETPDGLGPSLERRSPLLEDADPQAWAASILVGGTPGDHNSVKIELPEDQPPGPWNRVSLIPEGAVWRYFRGRDEPSRFWVDTAFGAAGWESGPAGFGYDDGDDNTILDDMQGNYTTVYIRHAFDMTDVEDVESLALTVSFDDGFVAYLNGVEVARRNAPGPAGTRLPHTATASNLVGDAPTDVVDLDSRRDLLVNGRNVLAVQGLNASLDSGDLSLHPSLTADLRSGSRVVSYVPPGEIWNFFRGTEPPPDEWTELTFADESWESGPAGFGYGDGDDATVLEDMQDGYYTVFIRRIFAVEDRSRVAALRLMVDYDDGFSAYLNGNLVASANVGAPGYDQPASRDHEAGVPEPFDIPFPQNVLQDGDNILAMVGHNVSLASSDLSLSPTLQGVIDEEDDDDPPPAPDPTSPPRDLVINELAAGGEGSGWVELFNPTDDVLDASGRRLLVFPAEFGDYALPAGTVLESGGTVVVAEAALGFELDDLGALILATEDGEFIDALNPRGTAPEHSTGRFPDGSDNRRVFAIPTPGEVNRLGASPPVVINEIMYHPHADSPGTEYVELYNHSDSPVSLRGWAITRGVEYSFPMEAEIAARGFVVVARNPAIIEAHYGIEGVYGPFVGGLRNDAETILVRDELRNPVDRVRFADDGSWPEGTDGEGASAELVHPLLDNRYGPAWAASGTPEDPSDGTPGAPNSQLVADPFPLVVGVTHSPVTPSSSDTVRVLASVSDDREITAATLFYEVDRAGGVAQQVPMVDDGVNDDGVAGNRIYGADIPPHVPGSTIAFWIHAQAAGDQEVTVPEEAPTPAFLYQVESSLPPLARPLYRIVMRNADLNELRTRNPESNELLDCTFVANGRAYYNRGIRLRGRSARRTCTPPRSYRIQFDHDRDLHGIQRLNLNGCNVQRQYIGLDFLRRVGVPTPLAWLRRVAFNGEVRDGLRLRVEAIDEAFLERVLPGDDGGNLYRGERSADLQYRGEEFDLYRDHYEKHSNEDEDDYGDVLELCFRLDPEFTSDDDYPATVEATVDIDQWALYFAAFAVLGSTEGAIVRDTGDDYYLYHRPSDDLWILLPWDLDSCYVEEDQRLFRPTLESVERFLENPRYAPDYWCYLERLLDGPFGPEVANSRIDRLAPIFPPNAVENLRSFVLDRREYIEDRLSPALEITDVGGGSLCEGGLEPTGGSVTLDGRAPGCGTTEVLVNGQTMDYDPVAAEWSGTVDLDGASELEIVSLYRGGFEVARLELPVLRSGAATPLPSVISDSLGLGLGQSPYRAGNNVTVEAGATLAVEPGVVLLFDNDATLRVAGSLMVEGSEVEPVRFQSDNCGDRWEGIVFLEGSTSNRLAHCDLRDLDNAEGYPAAVVVDDAELVLEAVSLRVESGTGLLVQNGATVEVARSTLSGGNNGVVFTDSGGLLHDCVLEDFSGAAVLASGNGGEPVILEKCVIRNCGGGVDSQSHAVTVRAQTRIHDVSGTAVRVAGAVALLKDSLFWRCGIGVDLTDGANGVLSHLTMHDLGSGLVLGEDTPGAGGGAGLADSIIVWEASPAVVVGPLAALDLSHSDTAGGVQPGNGNISADPLFFDLAGDDYRLRAASPCRRGGTGGSDMGALPYEPLGEGNRYTLCDTNGDGGNDISDPVHTLLFLFSGGGAAPCSASVDCNSDGNVDLSDAVFNLSYLFTGGPAPRLPYPACDEATVEECALSTCSE